MIKDHIKNIFIFLSAVFILNFYNYQQVHAVATIDSCRILDQPGETYYVTKNIVPTKPGFCISIRADDITLDCKDFSITGIGENTFGILVYLTSGAIVKNCVVEKFKTGIHDVGGQNNNFERNTSRYNEYEGMTFSSIDNIIFRNTVHDNGTAGMSVSGSKNFINNNISYSNTGDGIILANIGGHTAIKNLARHNKLSGILVNTSDSNHIVKNRTNSNEHNGIYVLGNSNDNLLERNNSENNGLYGFKDNTVINNNVDNNYVQNRCLDNLTGGSDPANLCKPQP
jgi:hypothetical protein